MIASFNRERVILMRGGLLCGEKALSQETRIQ